MTRVFAPILRGPSRSWWNYVKVSLHILEGHTACRQWARQILIWEVLFAATEYIGLQIRHVKIVTIVVFDKMYCMSSFCHDYMIFLASCSAKLLWTWTLMLYNIVEKAIYDTCLTTTYSHRSLLAFLYPDCSLLFHHCDKLESYVVRSCVEATVHVFCSVTQSWLVEEHQHYTGSCCVHGQYSWIYPDPLTWQDICTGLYGVTY
jgi:hypothetical protein